MDYNKLLVCILGILSLVLILAIAVLAETGARVPEALYVALSAALGALFALAHPPKGGSP